MTDPYQQLAQYLDSLPAGYPPTESGVELRILHKLFSPQEAAAGSAPDPHPRGSACGGLPRPPAAAACVGYAGRDGGQGLISANHPPAGRSRRTPSASLWLASTRTR